MKLYVFKIFLSLIFLSHLSSFAQTDNKFFIYSNLLKPVDFLHPKLNLGLERNFGQKHLISLESNFYIYNYFFKEPCNGISMEINYKFKTEKDFLFGVGLHSGYCDYKTIKELDNDYPTHFIITLQSEEELSIDKNFYEIDILFGKKRYFNKNYLESLIGLGFRHRIINYSGYYTDWDNYKNTGQSLELLRDNEKYKNIPILKFGIIFGFCIN